MDAFTSEMSVRGKWILGTQATGNSPVTKKNPVHARHEAESCWDTVLILRMCAQISEQKPCPRIFVGSGVMHGQAHPQDQEGQVSALPPAGCGWGTKHPVLTVGEQRREVGCLTLH